MQIFTLKLDRKFPDSIFKFKISESRIEIWFHIPRKVFLYHICSKNVWSSADLFRWG